MAEKVKLTREQADAVDFLTDGNGCDGSWTHEALIRKHAQSPQGWSGYGDVVDSSVLNGLPLLTLVDALRIGYEVEEALKIGDWAKFEHHGDTWVAKVKAVPPSLSGVNLYLPDEDIHAFPGGRYYTATPVTREEIKSEQERRTWAKIGRKPGDFKERDTGFDYRGRLVPGVIALTEVYEKGELQGFYPAESFIEFGGGEE